MKRKPPSTAFPLEDLFPGLHKLRPDIARREAEDFLEFGAKPFDGFDLSDNATRGELLDVSPANFVPFQPKLAPAQKEALQALPADWEQRPELHEAAYAVVSLLESSFRLPPHLCCTFSTAGKRGLSSASIELGTPHHRRSEDPTHGRLGGISPPDLRTSRQPERVRPLRGREERNPR